jgi:hypothetical protein
VKAEKPVLVLSHFPAVIGALHRPSGGETVQSKGDEYDDSQDRPSDLLAAEASRFSWLGPG